MFDDWDLEEEFSQPELSYSDDQNYLIQDIEYAQPSTSPPVEVPDDEPNIAFSTSINQSKHFLFENLNISPSSLHSRHVPGLIILRLEDFAVIRNDQRNNREIPHILIGPPSEEFLNQHPDFKNSFIALNIL